MKKLTAGIFITALAITTGTTKADDLKLTNHDDSI